MKKDGVVKLFKSHKQGFEDGKQLRDFVYVKDVVNVIFWIMTSINNAERITLKSGIYNLGTSSARTFEDLVKATFAGLDMKPNIAFVEMPEDIRDKYQYFTEAKMEKLIEAGYPYHFTTLEKGVDDYVRNYLSKDKIY